MEIILINGCTENCTLGTAAVQKICAITKSKRSVCKVINLNQLSLKPCTSCDICQSQKPGICTIDDGLNYILKDYLSSDVALIITPVTFGTCNSLTKTFLDRTQPLYLPYQNFTKNVMKNRYEKYPHVIFIGISNDNTDTESIDNFKNTLKNCTLSLVSNKSDVYLIKNENDINKVNFL